jgi:hypothetical protein
MVADALGMIDKTGERVYAAELYRLKGKLTLQQASVQTSSESEVWSPESEAEECFLQAIDIAQKQQANRWSCGR